MSLNNPGVGERYHSHLHRIYQRITRDAPHTDQGLALSLAVKVCNDTSVMSRLSPSSLVFCIVPRLSICSKDPLTQVERIEAVEVSREEMMRAVFTNCIKLVLSKNVPAAADSEISEGTKALLFHEKSVQKWVEPYVEHSQNEKC